MIIKSIKFLQEAQTHEVIRNTFHYTIWLHIIIKHNKRICNSFSLFLTSLYKLNRLSSWPNIHSEAMKKRVLPLQQNQRSRTIKCTYFSLPIYYTHTWWRTYTYANGAVWIVMVNNKDCIYKPWLTCPIGLIVLAQEKLVLLVKTKKGGQTIWTPRVFSEPDAFILAK